MAKNIEVGTIVKAYHGYCIGMGVKIHSTEWIGEVVKVNKKSIKVRLFESTSKYGREVTNHSENLNTEKVYRFAKTLSNGKDFYVSEGRLYGTIEI